MSFSIDRRTLLVTAAAALAATVVPYSISQACGVARVDVYDRSAGEELPIYRHHGRRYIEGRPGNEYAVRIRNCTGQRVLAVVSVDGVNAVTGETASPDQAGYVIEPWGYVTVQGWRKSLDRTAAFYFSDPEASYASRTGRPDDLGVVGVALFREKNRYRVPDFSGERRRDENPYPVPSDAAGTAKSRSAGTVAASEAAPAPMARQEPSLGTGHGRGEYSPVQQVEFERASERPDEMVALRYERRETLVAMGVLRQPRYDDRQPDPFPGALGFVPDP